MKRPFKWLSILLALALLAGCGDAGNYVKENYSLIDVTGQGKSSAKVYEVEGKDVPTVANELAAEEPPKEQSKESLDQMFLVYDNKIINVQKNPENEANTLVEIDSMEYARSTYDPSFLEGYVTATVLQSLFGGGWSSGSRGTDYRGYTSSKRYDDYGKYQTAPKTGQVKPAPATTQPAPTTSDRKGSFTTKPTTPSTTPTTPKTTPAAPSTSTKTPAATAPSTKAPTTSKGSTSTRKSDGSTPTYKKPSSSGSKPSTSSRSGSFKKK